MLRMLTFALVVPLVWFGVHGYVGWTLIKRAALPPRWSKLAWGALLGMAGVTVAASLLSRLAATSGPDALNWAVYVYMGFFSILVFLLWTRDLLLGIASFVARVAAPRAQRADEAARLQNHLQGPEQPAPEPVNTGRRAFLRGLNAGVVTLAGGMTAYGTYKALRTLEVVDVAVPFAKLPPALRGLKIVQISDLHVGPTVRRPFIEKVVAQVNALDPDLIVITGDLVDGHVEERRDDVAPLAGLKAREGVYYITGNHEYYWGAQPWIEEVARLGIRPLVNEHVVLRGGALALAGVADLRAGQFIPEQAFDPHKAIQGAPPDALKVLLAHQPKSAYEAVKAGFDLQLSGHTHGGQYAPWSLLVFLVQPFVAGLHKLDQMQLYVNRGTGYWGPPVRIGSDPEITRLTLTQA